MFSFGSSPSLVIDSNQDDDLDDLDSSDESSLPFDLSATSATDTQDDLNHNDLGEYDNLDPDENGVFDESISSPHKDDSDKTEEQNQNIQILDSLGLW
jgi:hypothetical protein